MKLNLPRKTRILIIALIGLIVLVFVLQFINSSPRPNSSSSPLPKASVNSIEGLPVEQGHGEEIIQQKPWVGRLPITNPDYYVEYDFQSQTIRATLYVMSSFSFPKKDQAEFLKKKVLEQLSSLGADTNNEKIEWIIESTDE